MNERERRLASLQTALDTGEHVGPRVEQELVIVARAALRLAQNLGWYDHPARLRDNDLATALDHLDRTLRSSLGDS